ncbi:putative signal peptide protein [Puccinia sorghi]|uniref:Putative signal peptide protein n=1 Tax=Puccinia sorghi TaxID=27349 RepID=A0A0L6VTL6_9BASI|nr:putative signal peptide protein [Puccinia sorghi]
MMTQNLILIIFLKTMETGYFNHKIHKKRLLSKFFPSSGLNEKMENWFQLGHQISRNIYQRKEKGFKITSGFNMSNIVLFYCFFSFFHPDFPAILKFGVVGDDEHQQSSNFSRSQLNLKVDYLDLRQDANVGKASFAPSRHPDFTSYFYFLLDIFEGIFLNITIFIPQIILAIPQILPCFFLRDHCLQPGTITLSFSPHVLYSNHCPPRCTHLSTTIPVIIFTQISAFLKAFPTKFSIWSSSNMHPLSSKNVCEISYNLSCKLCKISSLNECCPIGFIKGGWKGKYNGIIIFGGCYLLILGVAATPSASLVHVVTPKKRYKTGEAPVLPLFPWRLQLQFQVGHGPAATQPPISTTNNLEKKTNLNTCITPTHITQHATKPLKRQPMDSRKLECSVIQEQEIHPELLELTLEIIENRKKMDETQEYNNSSVGEPMDIVETLL